MTDPTPDELQWEIYCFIIGRWPDIDPSVVVSALLTLVAAQTRGQPTETGRIAAAMEANGVLRRLLDYAVANPIERDVSSVQPRSRAH